jgi:hypothetical protein
MIAASSFRTGARKKKRKKAKKPIDTWRALWHNGIIISNEEYGGKEGRIKQNQ